MAMQEAYRRLDPLLIMTFSDRTFGIPSLGYQEDKLDESLTNGRCSGNERHAKLLSAHSRGGGKSTYVADTPSNSTLFAGGRSLVGLTFDTLNELTYRMSRKAFRTYTDP